MDGFQKHPFVKRTKVILRPAATGQNQHIRLVLRPLGLTDFLRHIKGRPLPLHRRAVEGIPDAGIPKTPGLHDIMDHCAAFGRNNADVERKRRQPLLPEGVKIPLLLQLLHHGVLFLGVPALLDIHHPLHKEHRPAGGSVETDIPQHRGLHATFKTSGKKGTAHSADQAEKTRLLPQKGEIGDAGEMGVHRGNHPPHCHMAEYIIFLHSPRQKTGAFVY